MSQLRDVPARSETTRQALRDALRLRPMTAHELSGAVGVAEREIAGHLEHVERGARQHDERFVMIPPRCEGCGFSFKKRERLKRPSRCPVCRSERISPPQFSIET